jgi:hypothetical protein
MGLNRTIITKLKQKTASEPELEAFLMALLIFESESPGWYKDEYTNILERSFKEAIDDAHNEY